MLATAIIVFREFLEAAVVVGIVLAATKGVPRNKLWVSIGAILGLFGAVLVAGFAGIISQFASGMGQEVFNASVLFLAVIMLGWHSIWMSRHGREMARELKAVGNAVSAGARPLYAVAVVVAIAVLREGSEAVLFLFGIAASDPGQTTQMVFGGAIGLVGGIAAGVTLYGGLLTLSSRYLFSVTNWLIILMASGMASNGASILEQAGMLPPFGNGPLWSTAWLLSEGSIPGKLLHTMIGYASTPTIYQLVFYVGTLAILAGASKLVQRRDEGNQSVPPTAQPAE